MSEPLERICGNCNSFFPDTFAPTENGICLADEAFEPYLDDLLDYGDFSGCQLLIEVKKFHQGREVCSLYDEVEMVELPQDAALEKLVDNLLVKKLKDEPPLDPGYSFQHNSFAWLLKHDERLQKLRQKYKKYSAEERRMAADFEYHATSADQLFYNAIGQPMQPKAIPGEAIALAIDSNYAPAILTIGTHEYILGRTKEAMRLLLDLVNLPEDTEDLFIIIDKAASFLVERHDASMAMKLYSAASEKFPDEHAFQDGIAYCMKRKNDGK